MSEGLSEKVRALVDGQRAEWLVETRKDFEEAFTGQTIVDVAGVEGSQDGWAFQFEFASGTMIVIDSDPFSDLDAERNYRILGRRIAGTSWETADGLIALAVRFEDGEVWTLVEATGVGRVEVSGLMTKVETTD